MTKVLITGAGGYIGSNATYEFLKKDYQVIALDNFSRGYRQPLEVLQDKFGKDKLTVYELDLNSNLDSIFNQEKDIKAVIHFAAYCSVDESMKQPQKYFSNNVCGSVNLLSKLLENNIDNIVFSSTCAVYGEAKYVPVDEKHPTNPKNPYGESKLMVEKILKWFKDTSGLNYVILRYFNVCGASDDGLIGDCKKPSSLLVQNAVRGALGIEDFHLTCPKVKTRDGTPVRDYINVVDLVKAHVKAVEHLLKGSQFDIFNLGTGSGNSVLEVIKKVQEITGKEFDFKKSEPREGEYATMIASIEKAKKVLGWQPEKSLEDSIRSLATWYQKHPEGWKE